MPASAATRMSDQTMGANLAGGGPEAVPPDRAVSGAPTAPPAAAPRRSFPVSREPVRHDALTGCRAPVGRLPFPLGTPPRHWMHVPPDGSTSTLSSPDLRREAPLIGPCLTRITLLRSRSSCWDRFPLGGTQGRSAECSVRGSWQVGC